MGSGWTPGPRGEAPDPPVERASGGIQPLRLLEDHGACPRNFVPHGCLFRGPPEGRVHRAAGGHNAQHGAGLEGSGPHRRQRGPASGPRRGQAQPPRGPGVHPEPGHQPAVQPPPHPQEVAHQCPHRPERGRVLSGPPEPSARPQLVSTNIADTHSSMPQRPTAPPDRSRGGGLWGPGAPMYGGREPGPGWGGGGGGADAEGGRETGNTSGTRGTTWARGATGTGAAIGTGNATGTGRATGMGGTTLVTGAANATTQTVA